MRNATPKRNLTGHFGNITFAEDGKHAPTQANAHKHLIHTHTQTKIQMGAFKPLLLLCILVSAAAADTLKLQQPPRPTRTLGSLFGSKPTPIGPIPNQQQPEQQKVVPHHQQQQQPNSQVRPLVYQVKYYDRHTGNTIDQSDARNYGTIDKSGVVVDNTNINPYFISPQVQQQQQQRVYYYNPLIDTQPVIPNNPVYYTLAQVGNSQVLVPCTQDQVVESTVALNVEQKPVVKETVSQVGNHQHQQQRIVPPATVSQPLVREQVVAAAHELSALGSVPGSAIVGAGINSVPYGYYYYYYIPNDPQHIHQSQQQQQQPQQQQHRVVQHHPSSQVQQHQIASPQQFQQYVNPYQQIPSIQQQLQYQQLVNQNYLYRYPQNYQNQYPIVPVIVSGVPVLNHPHHVNQQVLPQVLPTPLVHKDVGNIKGGVVQQNIRQPVVKDNH